MYYLYTIIFKELDYSYVGCTNNIKRRKDQHNENSRKKSSKLGIFLSENNIVLKKDDLIVLSSFKYRKLALKRERQLTIQLDKMGYRLLNDNYTRKCSRKGKYYNNVFQKLDWVIIDIKNHTYEVATSLRKYAQDKNIDYRLLHKTSAGKSHITSGRYKAFKKESWISLSSQQQNDYLSGKFLTDLANENLKNHIKRNAKKYKVLFPDGHEEIIYNLDKFAREHNINAGNLHNTISKPNKKASGYKAFKLD